MCIYSYEDGNLVENLNDTTSLTYEVSKATATSKYDNILDIRSFIYAAI